jgi:hypothetical protein
MIEGKIEPQAQSWQKGLIMHMNHSMCHDGRKIREYFARKKMTRTSHPVYSPYLSPCDFWFCGYAKEQLEDRPITDESDLENRLTNTWGHVRRDVLQSLFFEWMEQLEWVIEHEGDCYINPH